MILLEAILQGFGLPLGQPTVPIAKIPLKSGLNVLRLKSREAAQTLTEAMLSLLFSPTRHLQQLMRNDQLKLRGGLTFRFGQETFRLVRDFQSNTVTLSQFRDSEQQFVELAKSEAFVHELLASRFKVPPANLLKELYNIGGNRYAAKVASPDAYTDLLRGSASVHTEAKRDRLNQLKKQLQIADQLQQFESDLDEIQNQIFEREEIKNRFKEKENQLRQVERQYQSSMETLGNVSIPEDIKLRVEKYRRAETDLSAELEKLDSKAEGLMQHFEAIELAPIFKNPLLIGGAVVFLVSAIVIPLQPKLKTSLAFGIVLAILVMAAAVWRQLNLQERHRKLKQQLDQLDHEKRSIEKRYEIEMATVVHLMKRLQVNQTQDLLDLVNEREAANNQLATARQEFEKAKANLNIEKVTQELTGLNFKADELRKKMEQFGASPFDIANLRREVEQLESELSGATSALDSSSVSQNPFHDPFQQLLNDGAALLKTSPISLLEKIKPGLDTNVVTLSGRRLSDPAVQGDRLVGFSTGKGGKMVPLFELSPTDFFYGIFALQFTLLQVLTKNHCAYPIFLNDLPVELHAAAPIVFKAVQHLAQQSQVIANVASEAFSAVAKPDLSL